MCGVKIILGYKFERSVHAHYRHAEIDGVDVLLRDVFCNGSAAARINLAELCGLPEYAVLCKERTVDIPTYSADASLVEYFPPDPVYLDIVIPHAMIALLRFSNTSG